MPNKMYVSIGTILFIGEKVYIIGSTFSRQLLNRKSRCLQNFTCKFLYCAQFILTCLQWNKS